MVVRPALKQFLRHISPRSYRALKRCRRLAWDRLRSWSPAGVHLAGSCLHWLTGRACKEDYFDRWTGRRDELTPPLRLLFDGTRSYEEFRSSGEQFVNYLIEHGLQREHRVLEVGSGNGKNARALTRCLQVPGRYEGFDVAAQGVAWCRRHITSRFPHFQFQHADIHNRSYHPAGRQSAAAFRFPYRDGAFDLVLLTSVFTHMLPDGMANYVGEISRVLGAGGRCIASFFLLNEHSREGIGAGRSVPAFPWEFASPACRLADPDWPEDAVAYDESLVRELFPRHGLSIVEPIHFGNWWRGEPNAQDVVWAVKR
jgi:SAM-dependent methyltransferase